MFMTVGKLKRVLTEVLYDGGKGRQKIEELNKDVERLKNELTDLRSQKRIEEEEIKHLVKMKEEKLFIEAQKKENELSKKFNDREMQLQKDYHDQVLKNIEEQRNESRELYGKIMERLPNVNVSMNK